MRINEKEDPGLMEAKIKRAMERPSKQQLLQREGQ
jgi:hypothetical protein